MFTLKGSSLQIKIHFILQIMIINITNSRSSAWSTLPMLPVPLARSRLLECLGAVTMCCFIDDDVICEGYSGIICPTIDMNDFVIMIKT